MHWYIHQEQGSHHWYNSKKKTKNKKNEHNTTLIIGQHDSCSRLLLSPYNASTLTFQSLTQTTLNNKKKKNLPGEPPPSSCPCSFFLCCLLQENREQNFVTIRQHTLLLIPTCRTNKIPQHITHFSLSALSFCLLLCITTTINCYNRLCTTS